MYALLVTEIWVLINPRTSGLFTSKLQFLHAYYWLYMLYAQIVLHLILFIYLWEVLQVQGECEKKTLV